MTSLRHETSAAALVTTRTFVGKRPETDEAFAALSPESQAGLRQFSLERMMGYGIDYADAIELRACILDRQAWHPAATQLAETALRHADGAAGDPTRASYLRRSSALLRMSQMMMLSDTPERRAIFARAADLYERAAHITTDRQRVLIETDEGPIAGWLIQSGDAALASAIVIGGVEGWAMDFDSLGEALAARGVDALMLDGPGQGETRMTHRHVLTDRWLNSYRGVVNFLERRAPRRPIGFIGNSMGGSFAMSVACADTRIAACCNNGGVIAPSLARTAGTFFSKMMTFCGTDEEEATRIWKTVAPTDDGPNAGYPLLMVQGGKDPMVPTALSEMLLQRAPTADKQMVIFSDGDHCIYNHRQDRDILISDWMRTRLAADRKTS